MKEPKTFLLSNVLSNNNTYEIENNINTTITGMSMPIKYTTKFIIYLKKSKKNINNFNKLLSLNPSLELLSSFMCVRTTVVIATKAHPQNKPFL